MDVKTDVLIIGSGIAALQVALVLENIFKYKLLQNHLYI